LCENESLSHIDKHHISTNCCAKTKLCHKVEPVETSEPVSATTVASAEPVTETVEVEEDEPVETLVVFIEPVTETEDDNNTVIEDVTYDEDLPKLRKMRHRSQLPKISL